MNLQGAGFADDNEVIHLERDLGVVIEVALVAPSCRSALDDQGTNSAVRYER